MKKFIITSVILIFFFGGLYAAQQNLWEPQKKRMISENEIEGIIPNGKNFNTLGFDHFVADMYWLKSIQYLGGNVFSTDRKGLFPLLDLVTDLNPKFSRAYKIGALILPDEGKLDETEILVLKGIEKNSDDWRMFYDAGFFYFYYKEDNEKALEYYEQCVQMKDCLLGGSRMVKNLKTRLGRYEVAIQERVEDLLNPDSSDEEIELAKKKIQESASLLLLNDAVKQYVLKGSTLQDIEDLKNFSFVPTNKKFFHYLIKNQKYFGFEFTMQNNKLIVDDVLLKTPYQYNHYLWSEEENRVRTRWF